MHMDRLTDRHIEIYLQIHIDTVSYQYEYVCKCTHCVYANRFPNKINYHTSAWIFISILVSLDMYIYIYIDLICIICYESNFMWWKTHSISKCRASVSVFHIPFPSKQKH